MTDNNTKCSRCHDGHLKPMCGKCNPQFPPRFVYDDKVDCIIKGVTYLSIQEHTAIVDRLREENRVMREALDHIAGWCEHIDDQNGELCSCSTQMDRIARAALGKVGK